MLVQQKQSNPCTISSTQVRLTTTEKEVVDMEEGRDYNRPVPVASTSTDNPTVELEDPEQQAKADRQLRNRRCPFSGIDLAFSVTSNGRTDLSLCYKFKKVRGDHPAVGKLIGYIADKDTPPPPEPEHAELELEDN